MVCIYCGSRTSVSNSRSTTNGFSVWRRRVCSGCNATTTSREGYDLYQALRVQSSAGSLSPFLRDRIFLDVFQSLSHRKTALSDATELTDTILSKIVSHNQRGMIKSEQIVEVTSEVLKRFDSASYSYYSARH